MTSFSSSNNPSQPSSNASRASQPATSPSLGTPPAPTPAAGSVKGSYASATKAAFSPHGSNTASPSPQSQLQHEHGSGNTAVNHNKVAIAPAVPAVAAAPTIVNGNAPTGPPAGANNLATHGRKPSVTISAAGGPPPLPNGASVSGKPPGNNANIQFGSMGATATGHPPQPPHPNDSLPVNSPANPRLTSPANSPSPIPQPPASGGRPPLNFHGQSNSVSFGNFGGPDANIRSASISHSPLMSGPQASHLRRDSSHSQHNEMSGHALGPAPGRGSFSQQGGRGRGYGGSYGQPPNASPGNSMRNPPNQPRNGSITSFQQQNRPYQPFSNPPHQPSRGPHSPMPQHAQPAGQMPMPGPHMGQPQFGGYPGQPYGYPAAMAQQQGGYPMTDPNMNPSFMNQWYHLYPNQPHMAPPQSPRPPNQYSPAPHTPFQGQYGPQPPNMSRTSSTISGTDRPASSTGKPPSGPSHTSNATQASSTQTSKTSDFQKPKRGGIVITDPKSGEIVDFKQSASPAPSNKSSSSVPAAAPTPPPTSSASESNASSQTRAETKAVPKTDSKDLREQLARQFKEKEEAEAKKKDGADTAAKSDSSSKAVSNAAAAPEASAPKAEESKPPAPAEQAPKATEEPPAYDEDELARWEAEGAENDRKEAEREAAYLKKKQAEKDEEAKREAEAFKMADEEMKRAEKEAEEAEEARIRENQKALAGEDGDASSTGPGTPETRTPAPEETPEGSGVATPSSDTPAMPPPDRKGSVSAAKGKPTSLKLEVSKPAEPAGPSPALKSLQKARRLSSLDLEYPDGKQAPNAELNASAKDGRFRYDREFLLQFKLAYTDKPSETWTEKLKETILDSGDAQSARGTPRAGNSGAMLGGRQPSNKGAAAFQAMGAFGQPSRTIPAGTTSEQRFHASNKAMAMGGGRQPTMQNPLATYVSRPGAFPQPAHALNMERTSSSTSINHPHSPRNASQRGGSQRGSRAQRREDPRDNKSMPLTAGGNIKPIEISAGGWKARSVGTGAMSGPAPGGDGHMAPDVVQRKVKAALNKMTPNNFDRISDQILAIAHQSKDETDGRSLRQVIQLTFEKATDEAHWAEMYAQFCKRMLESMSPEIKDENILDKKGDVVVGGALFRKYLLTRCQTEFERGWKVNLPEKPDGTTEEAALMSDEYYTAAAAKRRGLGLVRFIGELYKLQMLTERIMHECVKKLVDYEGMPDDAEVESLTSLLRTIGAQLDASEKGHSMMDAYFARINSMVNIKDLPSRLRFMLMDVLDLRTKYNWRPKNQNALKGPTTLDEVRAQAAEAERQKEVQRLQDSQRRGGGAGGRPPLGRGDARNFSGGSGQFGMAPPDYHKNTVGMDDLRRLGSKGSSRQTSNAAPTSFGPPSMFASARGSNTSRKPLNMGGASDSGASSRVSTPPALKDKKEKDEAAKSGANAFSVLAEGSDATSPSTSPALSKAQPANISEVTKASEGAGDGGPS